MANKLQGFAALIQTEEGRFKQEEIASQGGKIAHQLKKAHEWTPEEAREAGRKGGLMRYGGKGKFFSE